MNNVWGQHAQLQPRFDQEHEGIHREMARLNCRTLPNFQQILFENHQFREQIRKVMETINTKRNERQGTTGLDSFQTPIVGILTDDVDSYAFKEMRAVA